MVAAGTVQHMATQRGAAALFEGRHDLELAEADVAGVLAAPRGSVIAEDIRHLQGRPDHVRRLAGRMDSQILQWPFHLVQEPGRDLAVAGRVLELFVAQKYLDHADILMLLEQVGGKGMPQ